MSRDRRRATWGRRDATARPGQLPRRQPVPAFLQPDGDTVLVIGDVRGHDIEAAAAMGQVRTLVRGIAFDRQEVPAGC